MAIGVPRAVRMAVVFGVAALIYLAIAFWHPLGASAQATACVVTSTQDPVEVGKMTLRDAINLANTGDCTDNNTITFGAIAFPSGTPETISVAASPFELAFADGTTIDGAGHMVILDGGRMTGIFAIDPNVSATLIALTMQNGFNGDGGGAILNAGTLIVANSTMDSNSGFFAAGGAIENLNTLTVTNSTFSNNTAFDGGAIDTNSGALTVTGSTFVDNTAMQPRGVGGAPPPTRSLGPIRPADGFTGSGGAIFICSCTSAQITNSTFSGNVATGIGGAILAEGGLTLTQVTVNGNSAGEGGGIFVDNPDGGALLARNTLIAVNTLSGSGGTGPDVNGAIDPASTNNLIGVGDGSTGLTAGIQGNQIGTGVSPIAPLLGILGNYGGGTQTIPLLPGSPAIDTGTTGAGIPATDQRGKPRVGAPDIGAFESQGFALAIVSGTPQTKQINTAFAPLVVSVTNASEPVSGGVITFTGPASGAGIQTSPVTVTIAPSGQASITPIANGTIGGPYTVVAATRGAAPPSVSFQLTNAALLLTISGPTHLKIGETEQYTATEPTVTKAAQSPPGVVWQSSDVTIATVSADGKVSALHSGTVTISATTSDAAGSLVVQVDTPILTGVQPAPAPAGRPPGTAGNPGASAPAPAPAPPSR
jgi:predicted outer membrane repeat protein